MPNNGDKKVSLSIQIVVIIITIIVSVVATYYIGEGENKREHQGFRDKDIHLEYRISEGQQDIREIKELIKDIDRKLDEL